MMSSERAGTPTHGHLDREKAREVLERYGVTHPINYAPLLAALEACVMPDPRIARIEALCDDLETPGTSFGAAKRFRAILRGDQ